MTLLTDAEQRAINSPEPMRFTRGGETVTVEFVDLDAHRDNPTFRDDWHDTVVAFHGDARLIRDFRFVLSQKSVRVMEPGLNVPIAETMPRRSVVTAAFALGAVQEASTVTEHDAAWVTVLRSGSLFGTRFPSEGVMR